MANGRLNRSDRLFIRLANDGTAIANSAIWRKHIPRGQGRWKDITEAVLGCCDPADSFIIFQGTALDAQSNLTNVSFNGYTWSGSVGNGDMLVVPLPYNFAETIILTVLVEDTDMDVTVSTIQGDGVITGSTVVNSDPDPQTVTLAVTSTPGSQYLVVLTDD